MNISGKKKLRNIEKGLLLATLTLMTASASAQEYWLCAGSTTKTMPDTGEVITMWGFAADTDNDLTNGCGGAVQVPGPALQVAPNDPSLVVHLRNDLAEPVSLVINGQSTPMTPVMFTDAQGRQRMRSFTKETSTYAGPASIVDYSWNNVAPGTYLYQSGTHPAVQVQMGLYGSMVKNAGLNEAYPGITYDNEAVVLYSEIDPGLHNAVATGTYGTGAYTSTVNYQPKYFLINGEPYNAASTPLLTSAPGQTTLLRMLNAGLESHMPSLQTHINYVAEDGSVYPYAKNQYSALLAPGKTRDALFTPVRDGHYAIIDGAMAMSNGVGHSGGMLAFIDVAAQATAPVAAGDSYSVVEDNSLSIAAATGVLSNDTGSAPLTASISTPVSVGTLALNADGSFNYTPPANFFGNATFSYVANDGVTDSNATTVTINVTGVNDNPVTGDDVYSTNEGTPLSVAAPGLLANDFDVDGDTLMASLPSPIPASAGTLVVNPDGSFVFTPVLGFTGPVQIFYSVDDGNGGVALGRAQITVNAAPNVAPVANDDYATTVRRNPVIIDLIGNDTDIDGTVDPASIVIVTPAKRGAVTINGDGTVTYQSRRFSAGSDAFGYQVLDNEGAVSNVGTVRIDILRR